MWVRHVLLFCLALSINGFFVRLSATKDVSSSLAADTGHFVVRRNDYRRGLPARLRPRLRLRGGGGCGSGGCGSGGCGSGGGSCGVQSLELSPPQDGDGGVEAEPDDFVLEDGPGDLLDASSTSSRSASPDRQDMQVTAKEQALALAHRRKKREEAKQLVRRRAEGSLVSSDFGMLCRYFVTTWLEIQLRSCWRPVFEALQSDILDVDEGEDDPGQLTPSDLRRIVMSGLEIFDEDLVGLKVVDLKTAANYTAPSEEQVEERVARYMTLDTDGDGVIDLQEFSVRFLALARQAILDDVDDAFRAEYEANPSKCEDDISDNLIAFDERLQEQVRPLLKLIDSALYPLRTPGERAAALIARNSPDDVTLFDIIEEARPWKTLIDVPDDGRPVRTRTAIEAEVGRMEQEAIRHAIDYDRWEASALFAEALTGIKPPPKLEPACGWPTIGSVALESLHRADIGVKEAADINDCKQEMSSRDVTNYGDINDCKQEMSSRVFPVDAPVEGQVNAVTMCDGAGRGGDGVGMGHGVVFEEAGAGDGTEAVLPPFWQAWRRDGDDDDMPRHWHRGPLVFSRRGYRQDVSPLYLASVLANRAQLFRQACSAASFKLPQYMDAGGHATACDQPSREMEDLMAKCIEDLTEAEHKVWEGFDVEPREWLLRHGVNVLESIACQRALCDYVTNYGDCGARGMAVARDLGSFMAYAMLYRFNPAAIFRQHRPFRPGREAAGEHCCVPLQQPNASTAAPATIGGAGAGEGGIAPEALPDDKAVGEASASGGRDGANRKAELTLRVPAEYASMAAALAVAGKRGGGREGTVIEVAGGCDVGWDGIVYTAGKPLHPDMEMKDFEPGAPERRFCTDRLPELQAHINHALQHPQLVTEEEAGEIQMGHLATSAEPVLVTDDDLIFQGLMSLERSDVHDDAALVPYPNVVTMPTKDVSIAVRGPANARLWGSWSLDKNCRGSFEGLTCALARAPEDSHVAYDTFTILCFAGPWHMCHVDLRAGGPAGAVVLFDDSEMAMQWCGVGGMDDGEYRCHEGVVAKDSAMFNATASVFEFCGEGPAGCGTALSAQNRAVVRVNASLMQHNYNHIQLLNRPIVRAGNCTFWNHSYALWLAYETAIEGSQLAVEDSQILGAVWRNEWRPAVLVERNNKLLGRHSEPDAPPPSRAGGNWRDRLGQGPRAKAGNASMEAGGKAQGEGD